MGARRKADENEEKSSETVANDEMDVMVLLKLVQVVLYCVSGCRFVTSLSPWRRDGIFAA